MVNRFAYIIFVTYIYKSHFLEFRVYASSGFTSNQIDRYAMYLY